MICIRTESTDPRYNLALEEYLLKETDLEFFLLCRNDPSVIIGKHQNAFAEINPSLTRNRQIAVIRRITGGGTVYHDLGNLNYSFIRKGLPGRMVDFRKHTAPVMDFLASLGLTVVFDGRNSLMLNGKKISGNAEHVHRNRLLHHGTLLFSSDLDQLNESLKVQPGRYRDRAIQSIRSGVANLQGHLPGIKGIEGFEEALLGYISEVFDDLGEYRLTRGDRQEIDRLVEEKYGQWDWNFGYSPRSELQHELMLEGKVFQLEISIEKGRVTGLRISGSGALPVSGTDLAGALNGTRFDPEEMHRRLKGIMDDHIIKTITDALF